MTNPGQERRAIWKYRIPADGRVYRRDMPKGAQVLTVGEQAGDPHVWVLVDPEVPKEARYFEVVDTGREFDASVSTYLGTAHCGGFVWHVFEREDF